MCLLSVYLMAPHVTRSPRPFPICMCILQRLEVERPGTRCYIMVMSEWFFYHVGSVYERSCHMQLLYTYFHVHLLASLECFEVLIFHIRKALSCEAEKSLQHLIVVQVVVTWHGYANMARLIIPCAHAQ